MTRAWLAGLGVAAVLALAACESEAITDVEAPRPQKTSAGYDAPYDYELTGEDRIARIWSTYVSAGWEGAYFSAEVGMDYRANRASIDAVMTILAGTRQVTSQSFSVSDRLWFPNPHNALTLKIDFATGSVCGQTGNVNASFRAWTVVTMAPPNIGQLEISADNDQDAGAAAQDACDEPPPGGGGGGDRPPLSEEKTPTPCTDYYYYLWDTDTGEILSVTYLGCW